MAIEFYHPHIVRTLAYAVRPKKAGTDSRIQVRPRGDSGPTLVPAAPQAARSSEAVEHHASIMPCIMLWQGTWGWVIWHVLAQS